MFLARSKSPSRKGKTPRSRKSRQFFLEPLEDRRLMAILGDLTGGVMSLTGDAAANDLTVTNAAGNTYILSSAADPITITDNDATLTLIGNGTNVVTVTAPPPAVTNLAIDLAGAGDTITRSRPISSMRHVVAPRRNVCPGLAS